MNYDYVCDCCEASWEKNIPMSDRDIPTESPCPYCGIKAVRRAIAKPSVSYDGGGVTSVVRRAGSGWNDVLNKVKKASGRRTNIETL